MMCTTPPSTRDCVPRVLHASTQTDICSYRGNNLHLFAAIPPEKIGVPSVMFLYAAMSFVLLVFVILCIPETKGRTLEEISKELAKK